MNDGPRYRIVPYAVVDGEASLRPSFLRVMQERMRAQGLERWLLFDTKDSAQLESVAVSPAVSLFSVVFDLKHSENAKKGLASPAALFWLTSGPGNASLIHFCIFREYWGVQARAIGKYVLATLLSMVGPDGHNLFPVIMAIPPDFNTHAVRFARDIGMRVVGTVPNVFLDAYEMRRAGAVVIYMTAADLEESASEGGSE